MDAVIQVFRRGMIQLWSGSIASIPAGWHLCDGTGGTADLQDRFIVGAGSTYAVDATGGAINHDHEVVGNGHTHCMVAGTGVAAGTDFNTIMETGYAGATSNSADGRPPYYALCYIQKL